jgi:hypothetical protein
MVRLSGAISARCDRGKSRSRYRGIASSPIETKRCGEMVSEDIIVRNDAVSFFRRVRRAEAGHHHHVAGPYLLRYAQEASWREDNRRISNGEQVHMISGLAVKRGAVHRFLRVLAAALCGPRIHNIVWKALIATQFLVDAVSKLYAWNDSPRCERRRQRPLSIPAGHR